MGKIKLGTAACDQNVTPTSLRFHKNEQVACSTAFVLIVLASNSSGCGWNGRTCVRMQFFALFIETNLWMTSLIRLFVEIKNIKHAGKKLVGNFWDAPFLYAP